MKRYKAVSLIEILISLSILTVIILATLPVITVKTNYGDMSTNSTQTWTNTSDVLSPTSNSNIIIGAGDSDIEDGDKAASNKLIVYNHGYPNKDLPAINVTKVLDYFGNIIDGRTENVLKITNTNLSTTDKNLLTIGNDSIAIKDKLKVTSKEITSNIIIGNNIPEIPTTNQGVVVIGHALSGSSLYALKNDTFYILTGKTDNQPVIMGDDKNIIVDGNLNAQAKITVSSGNTYLASDKRLKNIKGEYKRGLKEILKVRPVEFTYKADEKNIHHIGVIAQELEKIIPEAVTKGADGYLKVREPEVFYALLNSVKELNTGYEKIKQNNDELEKQIAILKTRNS